MRAQSLRASDAVRFHLAGDVFGLAQRERDNCERGIGRAGRGKGAAIGNK